ncbi:hypothetical protein S245_003730 [Arachis hypogaea]
MYILKLVSMGVRKSFGDSLRILLHLLLVQIYSSHGCITLFVAAEIPIIIAVAQFRLKKRDNLDKKRV